MRQGFGSAVQKTVQFVIGGGTYEELVAWRNLLLAKLEADNPGITGIDWDYKETKPQVRVSVDYDRAADLGVTMTAIGRTLETLLGSRAATTFTEGGEEYDVVRFLPEAATRLTAFQTGEILVADSGSRYGAPTRRHDR